jgi:hypothetical protein
VKDRAVTFRHFDTGYLIFRLVDPALRFGGSCPASEVDKEYCFWMQSTEISKIMIKLICCTELTGAGADAVGK